MPDGGSAKRCFLWATLCATSRQGGREKGVAVQYWIHGGARKSTLWTDAGQGRNFQRTLSAIGPHQFHSGEIHMDQSLVHTFSWGNSYGPMVLKVLQKFPPRAGIGSMDGSCQGCAKPRGNKRYFLNGVFQSGVFRRWSGSAKAEGTKMLENNVRGCQMPL